MILLQSHKDTLVHYINSFPNCWKGKIRQDWDSLAFCTPSLRAIRNCYGPSWLAKVTAKQIKNAEIRLDSKGNIA